MHKITFFPLGNADCCRIDLENDKKILFDYANTRCEDVMDDKRIDLPAELKKDLGKRDYYDIVAFTHLDKDHIQRAPEFFWLQHDKHFQGPGRIRINKLWVPAAVITEDKCDDEDAKIIQAEARYRLKQKKDIRIFSRPDRLKKWLEKNGMKLDEVRHLVTDAGQVAPDLTLAADGVEFFIHSPFAKRCNEREVEDRNEDSLVTQATFQVATTLSKVILAADTVHDIWADIVDITKSKKREERLEWDVFKLAHHCSWTAIGPERGSEQTVPNEQVKWLFETQGQKGGTIISTSKPIPTKGSEEDKCDQPPHRQAANYYRSVRDKINGDFLVTMEHPSVSSPKPIVILIDENKTTIQKQATTGVAAIITRNAERAG